MSDPKMKHLVLQLFRITFHFGNDEYAVIPLDPDPAVARKAFRLRKHTGDQASYDIRLTSHGPECDCKGFLHRRRCKHIRMLADAKVLD